MPELKVPGASLHYEAEGSGPMLLCIHGGGASGEIWTQLSEELKDRFTVVFYDRRGFSQSHLTGAQDYSQRLETDADDAAVLIKHLSLANSSPATVHVIGNSSGAIVALQLLTRHPDLIHTLLAYEPPAARFLPDFDALYASSQDVYDIYRASGIEPGFAQFADLIKANDNMRAMLEHLPMNDLRVMYNSVYWFERELMVYPNTEYDVEGELRPQKEKLVLLNGEESNREAYQVRANVALAEMLGLEVVYVPGDHFGHATHPGKFAERLVEILEAKKAVA